MHSETIPLDETDCFGKFFLDYINKEEKLQPFYNKFPSIDNFQSLIEQRKFEKNKRKILSNSLKKQYATINAPEIVSKNIDALNSDKTFTITTGHQLNIFTGPLYFLYKLITAINTCKKLKEAYPANHFVPVYWMASEDHDYEEINHFFLGNEKISWETKQSGAVGKFQTKGLEEIAAKLPLEFEYFKNAYAKNSLAEAVRFYVNHLFGDEGLVVIDADQPELKTQFREVMLKDIIHAKSIEYVEEADQALEALGYKPQISARQCNFFYLEENLRSRIEYNNDNYQVIDHDLSLTENEIRRLIESNPEKFSPNVTLRPLYQEMILPNLAYIGGPAEMVYWLQLKSMFDFYGVPFPALLPRNYALIMSKNAQKKWSKLNLPFKDVFLNNDQALTKWVKLNTNQSISLQQEINQLELIIGEAQKKAGAIDSTLIEHLEALKVRFSNKLGKAEAKILKAEKRQHSEKANQINSVKDALFPNGTLQERKLNFIPFHQNNSNFIPNLLATFDPFKFEMYLLFE